ncbi:MAG: hypothetical protein HYX68_21570 [Planctomycetes bacterium]|nr:hypothetical protein [Planctomycetota bacterium]
MPFQVTQFPGAAAQIRSLARAAAAKGLAQGFVEAVEKIQTHLESHPAEWGDPEYNLIHAGGRVCHGIESGLVVRFALYEKKQAVCIIDIRPLPDSRFGES